jgi:hypothetical protein
MAVCKTCGCAIPLGSKSCDMCRAVGAVIPAEPARGWTPPTGAASQPPFPAPVTWSAPAVSAVPPADILKAQKSVRNVYRFIAFVAFLNIGLGALAELGNVDILQSYFDWFAVGEGVLFLVLAYFIRGGSMIALGIAIGLYVLDTVAFFAQGRFPIIRIAILLYLLKALGSANLLRQHRKALAQQARAGTTEESRAA